MIYFDVFRARQVGVVHLATGEYLEARDRFRKVLEIVQGLSSQVSRTEIIRRRETTRDLDDVQRMVYSRSSVATEHIVHSRKQTWYV